MKKSDLQRLLIGIAVSTLSTFTYAAEAETSLFEKEYFENAHKPGAALFNPPEGWHLADRSALPPSVEIMVVGKGGHEFPPSINLGVDPYEGNMRDYLRKIKDVNAAQDAEWKEIGTITTQAGQASLSQVDTHSEWGDLRMMHAIILKDGKAYILTAAALKEEFPKFYKDFFTSIRSLRFNPKENGG